MLRLAILNSVIEGWQKEYRFSERKWRFDYAHPKLKVAIEIEGGIWTRGRHIRGKGYENDMQKYNKAQLLGWKVLRYATGKKGIDNMIMDIEYLLKDQKNDKIT